MILVFGVHNDDAIFSCGEFIAQHALEERVDVVGLCSAWPPGHEDAAWQENLNMEHARACGHLGARSAFGGCLDGKWEEASRFSVGYEADVFFRWIQDYEHAAGEGASTILVPLGIHHPDHLYFAEPLWRAALERPSHVAVYEDQPYRTMYPEEVHGDLGRLSACAAVFNYWPENSIANGGFVKQKLEACQLYESQWSPPEGDAPRCCSVPERIWSLR
jgi:hypothetical protein